MHLIRRTLLAIATVGGVALVALLFYAHLLQTRAESLIRISRELSDFRGSPLTLATLESKLGRRLRPVESCTPSGCGYELELSNNPLAILRIVPATQLRAYFWLRDGVVEESLLDYTTHPDFRDSIVVHSQMDFNDGNSFYLHPWGNSAPLDTNGLVVISSGSAEDKKKAALALNVSCLTKPGGCSTVADLLPTIWERTTNQKIRSRLPNHEGYMDASVTP